MRSPFHWRFTPLFAVLLLAGCASTDNIAPQSTLMDPQSLQLAQPKVSSLAVSRSGGAPSRIRSWTP